VANPKIQPRLCGTCGCRLKALASAVESQYTVIEIPGLLGKLTKGESRMVEKHDTTDLAGTIAETLRSNPRAAIAALQVANTVEVASSISEPVEPSQLSDHGQAISSLKSVNQMQNER